ncbi:Protein of unknown function [Modicisalibacter muralis]|uniref:DUF2281 domain-containing protein n=1 Tax=Modicisalibacter muralis TaxID=119000 RepID=A0A1G9M102_9GAMM|nr:DUF2281 domain-containing protein [Halomonas muralis]SDL67929.1 Protein of unknown function [Halomonas muralis]
MSTAEKIAKKVSQFPESLQQEILDFVLFLEQKIEKSESGNLSQAQETSMKNIWTNDDDETWNDVPIR